MKDKYQEIKEKYGKLPVEIKGQLNDHFNRWQRAFWLSKGDSPLTPEYILRKAEKDKSEGLQYLLVEYSKPYKEFSADPLVQQYEGDLNKLAEEANEMVRRKQIDLPRLKEICEEAYVYLYGQTTAERKAESELWEAKRKEDSKLGRKNETK